MKKSRVGIPSDMCTEVMFASDRTCCVCRERGKTLQIHHIDEDPSNNIFENLSVLCLECHNDTQIKGGFGRKLNASLVIRYRDEWLDRVNQRRNLADEMAVKRQVEGINLDHFDSITQYTESQDSCLTYIQSLPEYRLALLQKAQPKWDTGITSTMVQASYDYIDALNGVLVALAEHYSPKQFDNKTPQEYFSEIISSRFLWHRTIAEPNGIGTGGTIVNIVCSGNVISDVEKMVEDIVMSLVGYDDSFDWRQWMKQWRREITKR